MIKMGNMNLLVNQRTRRTIRDADLKTDVFGGQLEIAFRLENLLRSMEIIDIVRYRHITTAKSVNLFLDQNGDNKPFGFLIHLS